MTEIGRIKKLINSQFDKYAKRFTKEVAEEIEQAYYETWENFMQVWVDWKQTKGEDAGRSTFMLQASDAYWTLGNNEEIRVDRTEDVLTSGIHVDPSNIKTEVYSEWGGKRRKYSKKSVFEMMYYHGIFGYNYSIVNKSWYRTKASQRKYYKKYHLAGIKHLSRGKILRNIYAANIIPPTAAKKPFKEMDSKYRKITTKKHLDEKWNSIVGDLDKDIERLINKKR